MKYILEHPRKGFLIDFDFHGKQEFSYSTNPRDAWVFKSITHTRIATRWLMREHLIVRGITIKGQHVIVLKLTGGKE